MTWELKHVDDVKRIKDDSGIYVRIHRIARKPFDHRTDDFLTSTEVRADLISYTPAAGDKPIMSWQGTANAVRKHLIWFMDESPDIFPLSYEHASYIGYELLRAETDPHYVQD